MAAYAELTSQGWTVTRPRGATLVAPTSPDVDLRSPLAGGGAVRGLAHKPAFRVPRLIRQHILRVPQTPTPARGALPLWGGVPDMRLAPAAHIGRALRRAALAHSGRLLGYAGDPRGLPLLRHELARMLATLRALPATAEDILITQGSQMALDLLGRCLLGPGDAVAVEAVGYRPAWAALANHGARLIPIAIDGEGMDMDKLSAEAARTRLRAVYLNPQHHYPTTVSLSPRRRSALLAVARRHRLCIIEDDYDHEFHYEGQPLLPLASADADGLVVYVGSLAKILAPGLRIGFVVAPRTLVDRLAEERAIVDRHGVTVVEAAVAELLEDGEVARHARRVRRIFHRRRDALVSALGRHLPEALSFAVPAGGMALWARVAPGIDAISWHRRARQAGVLFQSGADFSFDGRPLPYLRLGFGGCTEPELDQAARRLARALPP